MATLARLAELTVVDARVTKGQRDRQLARGGLETVADLLHHVPRRYVDRTRLVPIAEAPLGTELTLVGEVRSVNERRPRAKFHIVEAVIVDQSGQFRAIWFNQPWRLRQVTPGAQVAVSGVLERYRSRLQMKVPDIMDLEADREDLGVARIVPIHPAVGDASPGWVRRAVHNALKRARPIDDPVPMEFLASHGLMDRDSAIDAIHFPGSLDEVAPARRRLVYDELFRLEVALAMQKRRQIDEAAGVAHRPTAELTKPFLAGLPYRLTTAQRRVLDEIRADLTAPHPMHRLLQGEVGSGKTVVAVAALLIGIEGGWQGAIMAPTEVLAEQHYLAVSRILADSGLSPEPFGEGGRLGMESLFTGDGPIVNLALLTGSVATTNYDPGIGREQLREDIATGRVDLVVGTHALIQEGIHFNRLGIAVVDEQHRFGVSQRVELKEKAASVDPDLLIMTATPIPRTLSMTLYGDLDVSVIDEMPPGREPVETRFLPRNAESKAWEMVAAEVAKGRQAFVVCPLVEDSPKVEATSATAEHRRLEKVFGDLRVGLIHGQLRPAEKEGVMSAFRAGEIDVLVSTTVIEVGIDVPNATIMVIEDADRFGLSQLHQLRGRVGRGRHRGVCVLLSDPGTDEAKERISAVVATTDGFRLAEEDLRIRGQGTVFGTRQSGMKDLKLADLLADFDLLVAARRDAFSLVDTDPALLEHPQLADEIRAMLGESVEWLFVS